MKTYKNLSIRGKLIGMILLVTILALGSGFAINIIHTIKAFKKDMVDHTIATAQVIGDYCSGPLLFNDNEGAEKILAKLTAVPSIVNAIVYDTNNDLFAKLHDIDDKIISPPLSRETTSMFIDNHLHVFQPIYYADEYYGIICLHSSTELLVDKIMSYIRNMFILIAGLIIISVFLAIRLQRIISQPILHLANVAKQITNEENYSIRVEKKGDDEMGILYDGFNNMLQQIERREIERDEAEETLKKKNEQLHHEIMDRKLAEEQLRIFQKFAEASGQGMGIADLDGDIIYTNPALSHILGDEQIEDTLGRNVEFYYPKEYRSKLKNEIFPIVFEKGQWTGELPLLSKQDVFVPCIQGIFLIRDDNGDAINLANIITNITERKRVEDQLAKHKEQLEETVERRTIELINANRKLQDEIEERKQAEHALRDSEASLANAQRLARLGNWDWDIVDNELRWSEEIYRIFGLNSEKFGATYDAFLNSVHPDDRELVEKSVDDALNKKTPYGIDHRIVQPNGSELIVHEQAEVFFDDTGNPIRMTGTVQDITDRKKADDELKKAQAQLLQSEKMASLGMLVAGVAHEINTPVGAISSMYNTLARAIEKIRDTVYCQCEIDENENQKIKKLFLIIEDANQVITSATERVSNIVRRLKSFARLDEAEYEDVNIHDGIEDTLTIVHHELKHKATVERHYGDIPIINGNHGQLNQVYLNILINAVQSIEDKGTITISTFVKNDHVNIQFKDTGIGIPQNALKKIFDPGYTTKGVGVGTGLGLSICYRIVHEHGGKIIVESEVGKGTAFTIALPISLSANPER